MAPREVPKATPKVQRSSNKTNASKGRSSPATTIKKAIAIKKTIEKIPPKINNSKAETRQRTNTVPKMSTPNPKDTKSMPIPSTATKSAKKPIWKRRQQPAHSGVPVPEKMRQLLQKQLLDLDDSL